MSNINLPSTQDELRSWLIERNDEYRNGKPTVPDSVYDEGIELLRVMDDEDEFLNNVEPETLEGEDGVELERVVHPEPMLSTDKAYTKEALEKWVNRVIKEAIDAGVSPGCLKFVATPKLDGMAARRQNDLLATRGDGNKGTDISRLLEIGIGNDGQNGAGEVVVDNEFFMNVIKPEFDMEHPRNFIVGMAGALDVKKHHAHALDNGKVAFIRFETLPKRVFSSQELLDNYDSLINVAKSAVPYLTDGVVIVVDNEKVQKHMGATGHHHRWAIALKERGEKAKTKALDVRYQVGRTGRFTPVVEIEPVYLSNAWLSRATAHTAMDPQRRGIGPGAELVIIRSGEVIPYIMEVTNPVEGTPPPSVCPSCGSDHIEVVGEYMYCRNSDECPAQLENQALHFFKTVGVIKGFGDVSVNKLRNAGISSFMEMLTADIYELQSAGFSEKQAQNLLDEIEASKNADIEDWRILAAMGVRHLGIGKAQRLLKVHALEDIHEISMQEIMKVDGFGETVAEVVYTQLRVVQPVIMKLIEQGWNFSMTNRNQGESKGAFVFTGKTSKPRKEMQSIAQEAGYDTPSSVTNGCYLVTGENVGKTKIAAAEKKGAKVINEDQFWALVN